MVATLALFISACDTRLQPVYNAEAVAIPVKLQEGPIGNIEAIIKTAAINRGWSVSDAGPGVIKATLKTRTHVAVVDIHYTKQTYSINYVSSVDLLYNGERIHRNYNKWVRTLENDINKGLHVAALKA